MSDEELIDSEVEQSLEDAVSDLRALTNQLEASGDELTIEYGNESATVPAPTGAVEFEVEIEREVDDDGVEVEVELELEWHVSTTAGDESDDGEEAETTRDEQGESVEKEESTDDGDELQVE